jgi:hypothetical protein
MRLATLPASRVPAFEIETLLGSGTGTTYLARADDGRLLAVKDLGAMPPSAVDAVEALGERLMGIDHPGTARLIALDIDDGKVRMIREYVPGRASSEWPDREGIAAATRDVVAHLQEHGLVHGNLVPTNIVIGRGGRPIILDVGAALVARLIRGDGAP